MASQAKGDSTTPTDSFIPDGSRANPARLREMAAALWPSRAFPSALSPREIAEALTAAADALENDAQFHHRGMDWAAIRQAQVYAIGLPTPERERLAVNYLLEVEYARQQELDRRQS